MSKFTLLKVNRSLQQNRRIDVMLLLCPELLLLLLGDLPGRQAAQG
jgi:hypothetical protein